MFTYSADLTNLVRSRSAHKTWAENVNGLKRSEDKILPLRSNIKNAYDEELNCLYLWYPVRKLFFRSDFSPDGSASFLNLCSMKSFCYVNMVHDAITNALLFEFIACAPTAKLSVEKAWSSCIKNLEPFHHVP